MRYFVCLLFLALAQTICAQSVEVVELQHPAAGPVLPGTANHPIMVFKVYKNTGSPASNVTQVRAAFIGTAVSADWAAVHLYWDVDRSRTVTAGDISLATASVLTAGKATFNGFTSPIQSSFVTGYDYLVTVDVTSGATIDNTFQFRTQAADVTVSAGTVSTSLGDVESNIHTIRTNNGCEIDVRQGGTPIPSGTATHDVGYVPTTGGNVVFQVFNTGSGVLNLTGTPIVEVTYTANTTATVSVQPSATINAVSNSSFTIALMPVLPLAFSFTLSIENSDFDEFPYIVQCTGSAVPLPEISVEYSASNVDDGDTITLGSYTAGLPATMNFTIYNTGPGALNLNGTPRVDYPTQVNVNCVTSVLPSTPVAATTGSTSFTVQFTPVGSGNWTFFIWIENNDTSEDPFNIIVEGTSPPVTPTKLGVTRQPGSANATVAFGIQPIVAVQDNNGAVDTSDNSTVVVASLASGTGSLGGTLTATCVNGYATFTNLEISQQGLGYTINFAHQAGTFTAVVSAPFDVGPAPSGGDDGGGGGDSGGGCSTDGGTGLWLLVAGLVSAIAVALRAKRE